MKNKPQNILIIGYGNPGRLDDGLGPAFASAIEELSIPGITVDSDYQLTVEDAAIVAEYACVIMADASVNGPEPFFIKRITPMKTTAFTTHHVEPEAVMSMAEELFNAHTQGYALGIRGYAFNEFGEGLSDKAQANLQIAINAIEPVLRLGDLVEIEKCCGGIDSLS